MPPGGRNRKPRISHDMVDVVAQIEKLAVDRRDMIEIIVRRSVLAVPNDVVLIFRITGVREVFVSEIGDVVLCAIDSF
ncbi:hypothetical protein D1872_197360 [compost metagenome]